MSVELDLQLSGPLTTREKLGRAIRASKRTKHEDAFELHLRAHRLPEFVRDYRFAKEIGRQWRFDFASLQWKLAVEVEGLVVRRIGGEMVCTGRHASVTGFREDCLKYASAAMLGWTVLRFEQMQVKDGTAIEYTMRVLAARGWQR